MKPLIILACLLILTSESLTQTLENSSSISGLEVNSRLGSSTSSSADGTIVAFGAPSTSSFKGRVAIFQKDGTIFNPIGSILGESNVDEFGTSVSLSDDGARIAIGAPKNDGNGANSGHVRVFEHTGGTNWVQIGSDIDGESDGDRSGTSVSISANGTRIAIGAPQNDGNGTNAGHVRVYEETGGTWSQVGSDLDGEFAGDLFGAAISISSNGKRLAIGSIENDDFITNTGHVRIYEESGAIWSQVGIDIDGESAGDNSGFSVSISADGTTVAIGAKKNDSGGSNSGHARIYKESGGIWSQEGSDINGQSAGDEFGTSISLSADGSRLAIGEIVRNSGTGRVSIYNNNAGNWELFTSVNGEDTDDLFGYSIALSDDGSGLIVGAAEAENYTDVTETDRGKGYVYYMETPLPVELIRFDGMHKNSTVQLRWTTASETNNWGFGVERSPNGEDWETIGFKKGNGNTSSLSTYTFQYHPSTYKEAYYRLKQIDFNGIFEYSNIIFILANLPSEGISIFPNPSNGIIQISGISTPEKIQISLYDQYGKQLKTFQNTTKIEIHDLKQGIYFIEMNIGESVYRDIILRE